MVPVPADLDARLLPDRAQSIEAVPNRRVSPLRLAPYFRWLVYVLFAALLVSGCVWLILDQLKDTEAGEVWQVMAANLLMVHGGVAMATLIAIGALIPTHFARAWRARRNRTMGSIMVAVNVILIVTAFGLYYAGSDALRPWMSDTHIVAGLCLPGLLVFHIVSGRRSRREYSSATRTQNDGSRLREQG
jgi:MFS family permease